jgi:hypothetical protein
MARYIDADRMQDFLVETNDVDDWCVSQYNADWISSFIENQPTADVVEVVRCKDCIYKTVTEDGEYNPEDIVCEYHMSDGFDSDDYCSFGKRKVDE